MPMAEPAESGLVGDVAHHRSGDYVSVGGQRDLARSLAEYDLAEDVRELITARTPPGVGGAPGPSSSR